MSDRCLRGAFARIRVPFIIAAGFAVFAATGVVAGLQPRTDVFIESRNHRAIQYSTAPSHDPIALLNQQLQDGSARLPFDDATGYLKGTLEALKVPVSSQALVFSQTSAQGRSIRPNNPRAIYFNDTAAIGWVRGTDILEAVAQDPTQGVIFYTIAQTPLDKPAFKRDDSCLLCHLTWDTLGVPGLTVLSTFPMSDDPNAYADGVVVSHSTPISQRWSGWYVTGNAGANHHRGNVPVVVKEKDLASNAARAGRELASIDGEFDTTGFLARTSDIAALMVLDHQTRATNLLTRVGWEARVAGGSEAAVPFVKRPGADDLPPRLDEAVQDLVDYFLFAHEAPLAGTVRSTSGFAGSFAAAGPRDRLGRSLRDLDLQRRLLRYPCSYMIYNPAFDALPPLVKNAIYGRMWQTLSGIGTPRKGAAQRSAAERRAIVDILRDTRTDLPDYFTFDGR